MADHPSITEIIDAMEETCSSLAGVLDELAPEEWHKPTGCPRWDVQDVVSHIVGLENHLTGGPDPEYELDPEAIEGMDADTARFEAHVQSRRRARPAEMIEQFHEATRRGIQSRREAGIDAESTQAGPFGWQMPYWRVMLIRSFDLYAHEQDVRRAVGRPGNLAGRTARLVARMLSELLPGVLPGRVSRLADNIVVIEALAEDGSRLVTASAGSGAGSATLIRLPFGQLVAFACGRADADEGEVVVDGDRVLAHQVLASMGFTP